MLKNCTGTKSQPVTESKNENSSAEAEPQLLHLKAFHLNAQGKQKPGKCKIKFKPDFSRVTRLLVLLLGQSCPVPSTGNLQLPLHSWLHTVTALLQSKCCLWAVFLQFSCLYKWLAFWNARDPWGFRLLIHSHSSWLELRVCQGCAAVLLQPLLYPETPKCHKQVSWKR